MEYSREAFNPKTYYDRDQETNVMHYSWLHILSKITPKLTGYAAFSLIRPPPNGPTEYLYIDPVGIVLTQSIKDTSADTMALLIDHNIQVPAKFTDRVTRRKVDKEKNPQAHVARPALQYILPSDYLTAGQTSIMDQGMPLQCQGTSIIFKPRKLSTGNLERQHLCRQGQT